MPGIVTINITAAGSGSLNVTQNSTLSTDCADIFSFTIYANTSDSIDITLTGNSVNAYYILNGITTYFTSSTTVVFNTSLELYFAVENSGNAGLFDSVLVEIDNTTLVDSYSTTVTRENDSEKCGSSSFYSAFRIVSSSTTLLTSDEIIEVDTGGITLQLFTAVGNDGKILTIKNTSGSDIFVDAASTETIDGVLILTIPTGTSYDLVSNGTNWIVV